MPESIWNIEWPNVNTQRVYPFAEGQSRADGSFVIPNDFIVDMVLPVNAGILPALDVSLFHVAQLGVFSAGITISIAYNGTVFSTVNVPSDGFTEYSTFSIIGVSPFFDTRGFITIGQLDSITQAPGAWNFTEDTARILPTVIRPNLRSLVSMSVQNGTDVSSALTGDILLQAGQNIQLRLDTSGPEPAIIIDALDTGGFAENCDCDDLDEDAPPIRKINGVFPNSSGEIILKGTSCVAITEGTNELTIDDSCSEPCCDCRELQVVTDTLDTILNQIVSLEDFGQNLDAKVTNLSNNVLSSKTTGVP